MISAITASYAETFDIQFDGGNVGYIASDGENGSNKYSEGDYYTESSSENSSYSSSESKALNLKRTIQNNMFEWLKNIEENSHHDSFFMDNKGTGHITNLDFSKIDKSTLAQILNDVSEMQYYTSYNDAAWVNSNTKPPREISGNGYDLSELSDNDLQTIKNNIIRSINPNCILFTDGLSVFLTIGGKIYKLYGLNGLLSLLFSTTDKTMVTPQGDSPYTSGSPVRTDIYNGPPALHDSDRYTDRFSGYLSEAENEDGWIVTVDPETGIKKYTYESNTSSSALDDSIMIALLTDYNVYSISDDYVVSVDYTSDLRRWTVYKENSPVTTPIITDNPHHELDFNMIYQRYGAGTYKVVAEQQAIITTGTYITYDICKYLFDPSTGNILWYSQKMARNNMGGSIVINRMASDSPEWIATGDLFNITINELGAVETEKSPIQRED